jgi:hypothetical protein
MANGVSRSGYHAVVGPSLVDGISRADQRCRAVTVGDVTVGDVDESGDHALAGGWNRSYPSRRSVSTHLPQWHGGDFSGETAPGRNGASLDSGAWDEVLD